MTRNKASISPASIRVKTTKNARRNNKIPSAPLRNFDPSTTRNLELVPAAVRRNKKNKNKNNKNKSIARRDAVHPYIYANLDPFAVQSIGVKVPDDILAPSIAHFLELDANQFTDAAFGLSADLYSPDPSAFQYAAATIVNQHVDMGS